MTQRAVRARLKPIEEIPSEYLCCEGNKLRIAQRQDDVLDAIPNSVIEEALPCPLCGAVVKTKYVAARASGYADGSNYFPIACYEFDEGLRGG